MRNRVIHLTIAAALTFLPLSAFSAATTGGVGDYVIGVYVCGAKVLIETKNEGWVYIDSADTAVGQYSASEMFAVALQLMNNGKQIGRFFEPAGTVVATGCGPAAIEITTLMGSNLT